MAADSRSALDAAWGTIPQTRESGAGLGSFTRTRIDRIIALVAAVGFVALGLQALFSALGPGDERPGWHLPLTIVVFGVLAVTVVCNLIGRFTRITNGAFAAVYVLTLLIWPFATADSGITQTNQPWIFYLISVATAAAVLAFPTAVQVALTIATPLLYGIVRMIQGGFAPGLWVSVGLDVSFALILGGILFTLAWVFRAVAANVDETRTHAVDSYARAAAADAVEQERVSVAALMHDSVLAALISVERADSSRERSLAVSMAREALTRLANTERDAGIGSEAPVSLDRLADDVLAAVVELGVPTPFERAIDDPAQTVPGRVARAVVLAVTQAVANAIQHADAVGLAVSFDGSADPVGVLVQVRDRGPGFDVEAVPPDRLGISASIVARIAAVGGRAHLESGPHGTTVTLEWSAEQ